MFTLFLMSFALMIFMLPFLSSCAQKNSNLTDEVIVEFADTNLETAIREELDIPDGDITEKDMLGLTSFGAVDLEIESLDGLESAANLERLALNSNSITDISPLAGLTDLKALWLHKNDITDITPLAGLTDLTALWLHKNDITDITPLERLNKLSMLNLGFSSITDVSPLAGLTNLRALYLKSNDITDISPLAELTNLGSLSLNSNAITDISALAKLTNLESLWLGSNLITDISPLTESEGTTLWEFLRINSNPLSSATYSEHIPELENRGLRILYDKPGEIHGSVFHSSTGEGLEGVTVYLDVNHDGEFDGWEVSTTTSSNGTYSFKPIGAYNYQVRINTEDGKSVKSPAEGYYTVDLSEAEQVKGKDFELASE